MKTNLLFSSFPFIDGEKVTLTQITDVNVDSLWEIMGDEENYRFSPTAALQSREEAYRKFQQIGSLFRNKQRIVLGIFSNESLNRMYGIFEIFSVDPQTESVTVNFTLHRDFVGLGYASSALRAVTGYLFRTIGVHRIQAYVLPINYRGILVLERCGFQKEGTIREGFYWPDKGIVDLSLYSLLPIDLKQQKPTKKSDLGYYI